MDRSPKLFVVPVQNFQRLRGKWIRQRYRSGVTSSALVKCHLWISSSSLFFFLHYLPPSKCQCAVVTRIWLLGKVTGLLPLLMLYSLQAVCPLHRSKEPLTGGEGTAICHFRSSEQIAVSSRSRNRNAPTGTVSKSLCCQHRSAIFCLCQKTSLALVIQRIQ